MRHCAAAVALALTCSAAPAAAAQDNFELWLNPSLAFDLDDDTGVEIETAQRFRDADRGGVDTYYARLWLNQSLSDAVTLSGGAEYRINDGGDNETRLLQQVSGRAGIWRGRLRFEQRFVDNSGRMGLRLRPRIGVSVPLDAEGRWTAGAEAESFWTLQSTSRGGQDGLTGLRTHVGVSYDLNDQLTLGIGYLRQQEIRRGRPDVVGHAPLLALEFAL